MQPELSEEAPGTTPAPSRTPGSRRRGAPLARWAARAGVLMAVATTIAAVALKVQPPA